MGSMLLDFREKVDKADKMSKLFDGSLVSKLEDRCNFRRAGFVGDWSKVMTKPFGFEDGPSTFARIDQ
jgi:hypothetical protein